MTCGRNWKHHVNIANLRVFSPQKAEKLGLKLKLKLAEMFLRYVAIKIAVYLK